MKTEQILYLRLMTKFWWIWALAAIILGSCSSNYKSFYYQQADFEQPRFYVFSSPEDTSFVQYWKISSDQKNDLLFTEVFGSDFKQIEYFSEEFYAKGTRVKDVWTVDNGDTVHSEIIEDDVILWKPKSSFTFTVKYQDPKTVTQVNKTRTIIGIDSVQVFGSTVPALKTKGVYVIHEQENQQRHSFWQHAYYTKDHGFVKYVRFFPDGWIQSMVLESILTEDQWLKLKNNQSKP